MRLYVSDQVLFISELLIALITLKLLHSGVPRHVTAQVVGSHKSLITERTVIGIYPIVSPLVYGQP